ncbi:16S rRNA (adenine1518-N6/adenine1519-N6)-dimethyltransferase [Bathymodiolus platifrons methanotrophic gill symbiont]|uniref:NUDIX hydrolase n=1 Tax=Bathymodiolus platifrons methanotrophic gill symbiont TaxID=113268 RepID=UPI0011CAC208|nr:NUDIX domain-containing protein [Bathymodiolus platifrons methanotrophic gill symbiont]TXK99692.1 NUDIX hydrolase [Methylococcaceae bacterium HT1]TXL15657.1 NUDIX hydrolase [Methylococcaceae bacterium HT3]TXL22795.1 NUDIX hydrolase [Methylococcaceae bacterium HT2]GFO74117.1 16S rRNA (adenine1518-N6/adenine1519-N6)-dimethyltransferase [Bathymodiolus platifrons methanotrophic gill symbiont]
MNQELIAVVDENDQFIENQPRNKVHQLGLRHRAVHILLFNNDQQLFLQKRSLSKDINAGLWDTSAAGHVDAGESYDICAHRETIEELGVCVDETLTFLFKLPAIPETGMEFVQVYRCLHNGPFTLEAGEIDGGQWFNIKDISRRVSDNDPTLTDTFKALWLKLEE